MRFASLFLVLPALALTGCGLSNSVDTAKTPGTTSGAFTLRGNVHGGQQPVASSSIHMYAIGNGYGAPSVSVLNNGVTINSSTDGTGSFVLTGKYTCTAEQRVYLTATGGDAGSGNNPALAMMSALGRCGDLTANTYITINEVTTIASVWALAPFMTSLTGIAAPTSNTTGINNAFADVNTLASIAHGFAGGDTLPAGTVIPVAAINTLADILASCINSNGGSSSTCPTLFSAAAVGGVMPTDTVTAALNIAQHPSQSVAGLYPLAAGTAPFQPTLPDQPSDFTLSATFSTASLAAPSAIAIDASGNAWVTDATTNKLTVFTHAGAPMFVTAGLNAPSAIALDQAGTAWIANSGTSTLSAVNGSGTAFGPYTGGGLSTPRSVSVDGQGNIWLANSGNNSVSEFNGSGTALSGAGFATSGGTPIGIAINPR